MFNATADNVWHFLAPGKMGALEAEKYRVWKAERTPTQDDIELARKALEYAREDLRGRTDLNDYLHNLMVACSQETVDAKLAGITASLVAHYIKEVERRTLREVEAKKLAASTYAGNPGDRLVFTGCQVLKVIQVQSDFGESLLHKMVDSEGHALTWFSSGKNLGVGATVNLIATVKKHEEYQGVKQTLINRAEVLDEAGLKVEQEKATKKAAKAAKVAAMTPEQVAAKKAKSEAAAAKRTAAQAEHAANTTWCRCGLLKKDCPVEVAAADWSYFTFEEAGVVHGIATGHDDARKMPDYPAKLEAAIVSYKEKHNGN